MSEDVVPGQYVMLPGRGQTFIRELPGPAGAKTMVLVHGLTATGSANWNMAMQKLATRYHVIAIDNRGHGNGLRPYDGFDNHPFTLEDCADDLAALLTVKGISKAIFAGYSMGGPIIELMWHRHPEMVEGMILASTAAEFAGVKPLRIPLQLLTGTGPGRRLVDVASVLPKKSFSVLRKVSGMMAVKDMGDGDPVAMLQATQALCRHNAKPWLRGVNVPTAVIETTRDLLVPPKEQRWLSENIPHALRFTVSSMQGHLAFILHPESFWPIFLKACKDVERQIDITSTPVGKQWPEWKRTGEGVHNQAQSVLRA